MNSGATLRMLDRADKEVMKLSRAEIGAVYEFMHKFRHNPANPGLHLKQLGGDSRLWSARVNQDYRALLLHIAEQDYLLVAVKHRKDVYDNLDRYAYRINRITGGIEVVDLQPVGDSILGRVVPEEQPPSPEPPSSPPLFAAHTDTQLVETSQSTPTTSWPPSPDPPPRSPPTTRRSKRFSASPSPDGRSSCIPRSANSSSAATTGLLASAVARVPERPSSPCTASPTSPSNCP